jgi:broad specificity phosphatase PhoE
MKNRTNRRILLVRHGMRQDFVDATWRHRAERPHDPPLSTVGRSQAAETATTISKYDVDAIFSSPFLRTVETACSIASRLEIAVCIEYGLMEELRPNWFKKRPEILSQDARVRMCPRIDTTYETRIRPRFPERVGSDDAQQRYDRTVAALIAEEWDIAVFVGHGASVEGCARALQNDVSGLVNDMCGINEFVLDDHGWRFLSGSTSHLSKSEGCNRSGDVRIPRVGSRSLATLLRVRDYSSPSINSRSASAAPKRKATLSSNFSSSVGLITM